MCVTMATSISCQVLQCLVHCADLSNPSKDVALATVWAKRVLDEFFLQVKEGCAAATPHSMRALLQCVCLVRPLTVSLPPPLFLCVCVCVYVCLCELRETRRRTVV